MHWSILPLFGITKWWPHTTASVLMEHSINRVKKRPPTARSALSLHTSGSHPKIITKEVIALKMLKWRQSCANEKYTSLRTRCILIATRLQSFMGYFDSNWFMIHSFLRQLTILWGAIVSQHCCWIHVVGNLCIRRWDVVEHRLIILFISFQIFTLRLKYFTQFWNFIDILVLVFASLCIFGGVAMYIVVKKMFEEQMTDTDKFMNFHDFGSWQIVLNACVAVTALLIMIKVLRSFIVTNTSRLIA